MNTITPGDRADLPLLLGLHAQLPPGQPAHHHPAARRRPRRLRRGRGDADRPAGRHRREPGLRVLQPEHRRRRHVGAPDPRPDARRPRAASSRTVGPDDRSQEVRTHGSNQHRGLAVGTVVADARTGRKDPAHRAGTSSAQAGRTRLAHRRHGRHHGEQAEALLLRGRVQHDGGAPWRSASSGPPLPAADPSSCTRSSRRHPRITQPLQNFPLRVGAQRYVLLAGGIGITAIANMAAVLRNVKADYTFVYAGRSPVPRWPTSTNSWSCTVTDSGPRRRRGQLAAVAEPDGGDEPTPNSTCAGRSG